MRISTWLRLVVVCLLGIGIQASCSQVSAQPKPPRRESKKPLVQQEFQGIGLTQRLAEADAVERACDWIGNQPDFGWQPSPDYLHEKGMIHLVGEPSEKEFEIAKDVGNNIAKDGKMTVVTMQLEITADQKRDMQKQAQHLRMKERHKHSLFGLLGAVALLSVVGGYLRLEEATKGYYTRLLRIAAVGVLVVIVAGLCVVG
jgi:hypothetical protein